MKSDRLSIKLLLLFSFFLNPIIIGGISTICYLLIYGLPCIFIFFNLDIIKKYFAKPVVSLLIILWVVIALILSIVIPILHSTYDFSYVNTVLAIVRKSIIYTFLFLSVSKYYDEEITEHFMKYFVYATVLYVLVSLVFAVFPSLRSIWSSLLNLDIARNPLFTSYGYTVRFGWSGFSGFRNTIDCSIATIFLTYLYAGKDSKLQLKTYEYVLLVLICFLGNMFYGRTGVIVSFLCIVVGLLGYHKINVRFITGAFIGVGFLATGISFFKNRIVALNEWYIWLSTPFKNFITTGSFNNYSADHLMNDMIFMPNVKTMILGDGRYVSTEGIGYYMNTDSGFMRQILFWGIIITTIMYFMWLVSLFCIQRSMILKAMLLIACIVFEIKGETYYELLPLFAIIICVDYSMLALKRSCSFSSSLNYSLGNGHAKFKQTKS